MPAVCRDEGPGKRRRMRQQTPFLSKRALRWKLRVGPEDADPLAAGEDLLVSPRRIGPFDAPEAPEANSLIPSVNVVLVNKAGEFLMIHRTDNGEVRQEFDDCASWASSLW